MSNKAIVSTTKDKMTIEKRWPMTMQTMASLLLTGLFVMISLSAVVKPTPVNKEIVWKDALDLRRPVIWNNVEKMLIKAA